MPRSEAAAETWPVGTQTVGWRADVAQVVPSGLVLGTGVEPAALGPSNPSNENIMRTLLLFRFGLEPTQHFIFIFSH